LAAPSLGDIHQGLGALQADLNQLGSSRVNGLIQQVMIACLMMLFPVILFIGITTICSIIIIQHPV
jgi:hypothetical protein